MIDDNQVNTWLCLSHCSSLTVACFLHPAVVAPPGSGDPVRPNTPLAGHNQRHLDPDQFDVAEFYTKPDSDSDVQDDVGRCAKHTKAFPRSHASWQKRIQSNDRKVIRFQDHSQELISHPCVKHGAGDMGSYAGQDVQNVALPPGAGHLRWRWRWDFYGACLCWAGSLEVLGGFSFVSRVFLTLFSSHLFPIVEVSGACLCRARSSLHLRIAFLLFHRLSSLVLLSFSLHLLIVFLILSAPPYSFPILPAIGQFLFLQPFLAFFCFPF